MLSRVKKSNIQYYHTDQQFSQELECKSEGTHYIGLLYRSGLVGQVVLGIALVSRGGRCKKKGLVFWGKTKTAIYVVTGWLPVNSSHGQVVTQSSRHKPALYKATGGPC